VKSITDVLRSPPPIVLVMAMAGFAALPPNIMPVLSRLLAETHGLNDAELGYFIASGTTAGFLASLSAPLWINRIRGSHVVGGAFLLYAIAAHGLYLVSGDSLLYALQFLLNGSIVIIASVCSAVFLRSPNPARIMSIKISNDVIIASCFLYLLPIDTLGLTGIITAISVVFVIAALLAMRWPATYQHVQPRGLDVSGIGGGSRHGWYVLITLTVFYAAGVSAWNYLGRLASAAGLDNDEGASAIAAGLFLGVFGALSAAWLTGSARGLILPVTSGVIFVLSIAALGIVEGYGPFLIASIVFNISWNLFIPFLMALLPRADNSGRLSSLLPATAMAGGILGPPLTGNLILWFDYDVALIGTAVLASTAIAGFAVLSKQIPVVPHT
jgi:hypothetical protein